MATYLNVEKQNVPPRRVAGQLNQRLEIFKELHDGGGHRGSKNLQLCVAKISVERDV